MHKRGQSVMWCLCVFCVCVRVSVTFVHCVKTNKDIFEIFSPSGSHTVLVFLYQTGWRQAYSDGNPSNGDVECRWGRQKSRFWALCLLLTLQQTRCCQHGRRWNTVTISQVVTLRWSYTAGIRPPSSTRDKVTVCVVLQRESDKARSRTIHNHDRLCVWQQGLTLRRRQRNRIKFYALVNPKLK